MDETKTTKRRILNALYDIEVIKYFEHVTNVYDTGKYSKLPETVSKFVDPCYVYCDDFSPVTNITISDKNNTTIEFAVSSEIKRRIFSIINYTKNSNDPVIKEKMKLQVEIISPFNEDSMKYYRGRLHNYDEIIKVEESDNGIKVIINLDGENRLSRDVVMSASRQIETIMGDMIVKEYRASKFFNHN